MVGSSPLTRGKPGLTPLSPARQGLIPAHAGKTSKSAASGSAPQAHPRSRGENAALMVTRTGVWGSSPLTRGKRGEGEGGEEHQGLIPAHAGKTRSRIRLARPRGAHPRSRGENVLVGTLDRLHEGSSPLTRGKRSSGYSVTNFTGLIPAHAGKTLPDLRFYRVDRSDLGKP